MRQLVNPGHLIDLFFASMSGGSPASKWGTPCVSLCNGSTGPAFASQSQRGGMRPRRRCSTTQNDSRYISVTPVTYSPASTLRTSAQLGSRGGAGGGVSPGGDGTFPGVWGMRTVEGMLSSCLTCSILLAPSSHTTRNICCGVS